MREQIPITATLDAPGGITLGRCLRVMPPMATTGGSEAIRAASLTRSSPTGSCPVTFVSFQRPAQWRCR